MEEGFLADIRLKNLFQTHHLEKVLYICANMTSQKPLKLGNITIQTDKTLVDILNTPEQFVGLLKELIDATRYEIYQGHFRIEDNIEAAKYIQRQRGYAKIYLRILEEALGILGEDDVYDRFKEKPRS